MSGAAPVLVVGGRTTGLTMACELARRGVPVRIIDRSDGIDPHCRATVLHSRTLELFDDLGIVHEVLARGVRLRGVNQYANGRCFSRARYDHVDSPYPWSLAIGQCETEAVLERRLAALGVRVERRTELIGLTHLADGVRATIRRPDGREETADTAWLVGCDGAHSAARHLSHEEFPGETDPRQYVLADVVIDSPLPRDEVHAFLTDAGALFLFVLPGERSFIVADVPEHHDVAGEAPTLADIQALVDARGPGGVRLSDPRWLTYFRINYRLAEHYRHGRVLLAGDAAHIHSPVGGQGMNTGIQDAYNLGWKLALVAAGRAPAALLDSYEIERRAVAADVLQATRSATEHALEWAHLTPEERRRLEASMVVPEPERLTAARHVEELDLDYRRSPICADAVAADRIAGVHAGAQAPEAGPLRVDGGDTTLFGLLRGTAHTLLAFPAAGGAAALGAELAGGVLAAHGDLLSAHLVVGEAGAAAGTWPAGVRVVHDVAGALARRLGADAPCLYVVRPDGYVGFRSAPADVAALRAWLDRVYGPGR